MDKEPEKSGAPMRVGETTDDVKIRPRAPVKAGDPPVDADPAWKGGPLPKRSDPDWLARLPRLAPLDSRMPDARSSDPATDENPGGAGSPAPSDAAAGGDPPPDRRKRRRKKRLPLTPRERFLRWLETLPVLDPAFCGSLVSRIRKAVSRAAAKWKSRESVGAFPTARAKLVVVVGSFAGLLAAILFFLLGRSAGFRDGVTHAGREFALREAGRVLPDRAAARLDSAMDRFRLGDSEGARREILEIAGQYPDVPALRHLAALAAMRAGPPAPPSPQPALKPPAGSPSQNMD